LAAAGACAALAALAPAGLDGLVRRALIWEGQRAAGAVVDVASARLRLISGRLELRSVAVADKRRPFRNLFQFDKAVLDFSPKALLRGRVLVREAGIEGLVAGGARASSGALRGATPSSFEAGLEEQLAPASGSSEDTRALDQLEARLNAIPRDPLARPPFVGLEQEVKSIQAAAASLGAAGMLEKAALAKRAQALAGLQGRAHAAQSRLQEAEAELDARFDGVRQALAQAEDARRQDVDTRLARAGIPELDAAGLDRRLFGPSAAEVLVPGLSWVRSLQPGAGGFGSGRPALVIETTRLSGTIAGAAADQDMNLEGMILGLSSDPRIYGKPVRLIFKGEVPGGASVLGLQGIQQRDGPGSTELAFHYSGVALAGALLGDDRLGAAILGGVGRVNGTLAIDGGRWTGRFSFSGQDLRLSPRVRQAGPAAARVAAVLRAIRSFKADVLVDGQDDRLRVALTSTLGPALSAALLSGAPPRWMKERRKAEAEDAGYGKRLAAARARAETLRAAAYAPLRREGAALAAALSRTQGQAIEASFPGD